MLIRLLSMSFAFLYQKYPLKKLYLALVLVFIFSTYGYGQRKNFFISKNDPSWIVKVSPKNVKPSPKDVSEGYFLSFYENQNHVELQEDYTHLIREIVSDAGVQNGSQISITYDPDFQKLNFHKIIVWRDGKPSDRLKADNFKLLQTEKELSRFIYSGTYSAFMLLEDVRKGDRIEFSYTIKGFNPVFGKKYASVYYFEGGSSIGHMYSNVIFSHSRSLDFKNFNFTSKPKTSDKNGLKMYEWESTLTKTHRTTDYEPSWYNPLRRTQLTEYKNWNEVVEWGLAVNNYPNLKTPSVDKKVKELKAKAGNDLKKYIELCVRFVQNEIRYMGIEMGIYSHRPNSPEKVLKQRYGDCKDKSLLLVKLLEAQGINSYMVYADTYSTIKTDQYLPSPFIFNHVIVMIDYLNYKTWVDPTISYQRGSFDNFYAPNYGNVLVIKKGVNALEKIESRPLGKLIANLTFNLADTVADSKTTLIITSIYSDNYADDIRAQIAEYGTDELEKDYLEYYEKLYPEIETGESLQIEDNEESNVLEITESYEISNIWTENAEMNDQLVYFYGDLISHELKKITAKNRLTPLALKRHINLEQNITVNLPYDISFNDDHFKVENDNYFFDIYRIQRSKELRFSYTFRNSADYIEADKIKDYVKDVKKIDEYLTHYIGRGRTGIVATGINFYTLLPYLLFLGISIFFLLNFYHKKETFEIEKIADALPIGGWLIFLALRIIILPFNLLAKPFMDLFGNASWQSLSRFNNYNEYIFKSLFISEAIIYAMLFAYSILCAVLFFQRRKDFPKHFIILTISYLAFVIFDFAGALFINYTTGQSSLLVAREIGSLIGSLIFSTVWIWYLVKSERVKETFVFTYPKSEWEPALTEYYNNLYAKREDDPEPTEPVQNNETEFK